MFVYVRREARQEAPVHASYKQEALTHSLTHSLRYKAVHYYEVTLRYNSIETPLHTNKLENQSIHCDE